MSEGNGISVYYSSSSKISKIPPTTLDRDLDWKTVVGLLPQMFALPFQDDSNQIDVRFYSGDVLVVKLGPAPSLLLKGGTARDRAYNLSGHSKMHILSYISSVLSRSKNDAISH